MRVPKRVTAVILIAFFFFTFETLKNFGTKHSYVEPQKDIRKDESVLLKRPYLFIHIPKSGGTSIGKVAERDINGGTSFIRYWHHPVKKEVIEEMLAKDFIFGHFKYGLHAHFNTSCSYMTILRDPVERVISHYYYHLKSTGDRFHSLAEQHPLEEWCMLSTDANNDQVQFISGRHGIPTQEDFEIAKQNLQKFGFVGIYERFDETMVLLKFYAGFQNITYSKTKSVIGRPLSTQLNPDVVQKIKQVTEYDQKLYEIGLQMFEAQIERVGREIFEEELNKFKQEQKEFKPDDYCEDCLTVEEKDLVNHVESVDSPPIAKPPSIRPTSWISQSDKWEQIKKLESQMKIESPHHQDKNHRHQKWNDHEKHQKILDTKDRGHEKPMEKKRITKFPIHRFR